MTKTELERILQDSLTKAFIALIDAMSVHLKQSLQAKDTAQNTVSLPE